MSRWHFKVLIFLVAIIVSVMDIYVFINHALKKNHALLLVKMFKVPIFYVDVIMAGYSGCVGLFNSVPLKCDSAL